jgi:hypothetical protein
MTENKYTITLFEACEMLSRSQKSISRYIRKGLLKPKQVKSKQGTLAYRFSEDDLKAFKEKESETRQDRQDTTDEIVYNPLPEQTDDLFLTEIKTDETRQDTPDRTDKTGQDNKKETSTTTKKVKKVLDKKQTEQTGHLKTPEQTRQDNQTLELLKETTSILKEQLHKKDEQIKDLGGKIDQLIERDRETNILLRGLQEKILLLDKPAQTRQDKGKEKDKGLEGKKIANGFFNKFFK